MDILAGGRDGASGTVAAGEPRETTTHIRDHSPSNRSDGRNITNISVASCIIRADDFRGHERDIQVDSTSKPGALRGI